MLPSPVTGLLRHRHRTDIPAAAALLIFAFVMQGTEVRAAEVPESVRQQEAARIQTLQRIAPSVVCVMPPGGVGGGSGVLISSDGYAVSNFHVTSGSGNFMKCGLNDGNVYDAVIVGIDPTGDVALIRLLGRDDFPACEPGNSDDVRVGDEVLALGNPFLLATDFTPTVTYGIVSGVHRYQYPAGTFLEYTDCIQIDASINPGNSGGPLFDIQGRWIGINGRASFEKRGRVNTGAAYAISVHQVQMFVEHLKSGRIVDHARPEFTVRTADGVVEIDEVSEISEPWRRGLRSGDELVSFAGHALTSANDFKNVLGIYPEGVRVPFTFRNREGVRHATMRLNPLHGFAEVPQMPGAEKPRRPGDPEEPDKDHEDEDHTPEDPEQPGPHPTDDEAAAPQPPEEFAHLFEEKQGFTNFYFNRVEQERLLSPFQKLIPDRERTATWVLQVSDQGDDSATAELVVGVDGAGIQSGRTASYQPLANVSPENEPADRHGLLSGMLLLHRLFRGETSLFTSVTYFGRHSLLTSETDVAVLLIEDSTMTTRWYFSDDSPLPVGADVRLAVGADEGRLRFSDWKTGEQGIPVPEKIGVIDNNTEQIHWLKVNSFSHRSGTPDRKL